jgi:hypothetical protein
MFESGLDDFAWVDGGAVDGSSKEVFDSNQSVLRIEKQDGEDFVLEGAESCDQ